MTIKGADALKPIIGITSNIETREFLPGQFNTYHFVSSSYMQAVETAGGIPVVLPTITAENQAQLIEVIDGLLLTGGFDIHPRNYQEERTEFVEPVSPEKDASDFLAFEQARKQGKAILGICRGMQVMNVSMGGTLCQDVSICGIDTDYHQYSKSPFAPVHEVATQPDTLIRKMFGSKIMTNSLHHQSIRRLADNFAASAISSDGIIEAIEDVSQAMLGIQWHPELLEPCASCGGHARILFTEFIAMCQKTKRLY